MRHTPEDFNLYAYILIIATPYAYFSYVAFARVVRSGAGLESGGQSALKLSERPLPRVVIQSKNCLVYSCV